ncbi:MAG: polyphenol oxidase family protein [Coriobacteriaceae bacterium]|nr:polyphenol oxidase family protein [Coriobacteriaceae bacterium]
MGLTVERKDVDGVALVAGCDGHMRFGFTERTGGVSLPPYASLNLGSHVGDDPAAVTENRRRVLAALGCEGDIDRLLVPNQVHGDHVAVVRSAVDAELGRVREEIAQGADAIVCTVSRVPVLLCFADCVPVILTAPAGFAVVHSGWKGTYARIAAKAARALMEEAGCSAQELKAYIGPHIQGDEYEVSEDLIEKFDAEFGWENARCTRLLNLSQAIQQALAEIGVPDQNIEDLKLSTVRENDRFFSYRAEQALTGRHAAVAVLTE